MTKKRKLGSSNPKYKKAKAKDNSIEVIKKHMCDAVIRDASGNIVPGRKAPVYAIWEKKI